MKYFIIETNLTSLLLEMDLSKELREKSLFVVNRLSVKE